MEGRGFESRAGNLFLRGPKLNFNQTNIFIPPPGDVKSWAWSLFSGCVHLISGCGQMSRFPILKSWQLW